MGRCRGQKDAATREEKDGKWRDGGMVVKLLRLICLPTTLLVHPTALEALPDDSGFKEVLSSGVLQSLMPSHGVQHWFLAVIFPSQPEQMFLQRRAVLMLFSAPTPPSA